MEIKIACPSGAVTGGVELLHQIAAELNRHDGVTAEIWYIGEPYERAIPNEYACYKTTVNNRVGPDDVLLFPEIWASFTTAPKYRGHKTVVYWESVDNYFPHTPPAQWFKFSNKTIHISQSEYATRFLTDVVKSDVIEVSDYIHDDFKDVGAKREPIALFNPAKGFEYTDKLIHLLPDVRFIPIIGMKRWEIVQIMQKSMVYIDFGPFPGKDRLPREAAACGMCIITGKRGAAKYQADIAIPEPYKVSDANFADLRAVADKIRDMLEHFDDRTRLFDTFRKSIGGEKKRFETGVRDLVGRLNEI